MKNYQLSSTLTPETKIWRYMSLDKLIDILSTRELYFAPISSYSLTDPYEGLVPKVAMNVWADIIESSIAEVKEKIKPLHQAINMHEKNGIISPRKAKKEREEIDDIFSSKLSHIESVFFKATRSITVNCWHQNDYESEGMWRLYSDTNKGIAIQSTIGNLIDSIETEFSVKISEVKYLDYSDPNLKPQDCMVNGSTMAFLKRHSFSHEKEIRLTISPNLTGIDFEKHVPSGIRVKVDPLKLIENIYISPYVSQPYPNAVGAIAEKFGIHNKKLVNSKLLTVDDNLLKLF